MWLWELVSWASQREVDAWYLPIFLAFSSMLGEWVLVLEGA